VLLSVRPEHLRLVPPQDGQPVGRVVSREFKGHDLTLHVEFGDRTYTVQTDYTCPFGVGDAVGIVHAEPAVVVDHEQT
jgi:iron(III) transport system ATP-binding protein